MYGIKNISKTIDKRIIAPLFLEITVYANENYKILGPLTGNFGQSNSNIYTIDKLLSNAGEYNGGKIPVFNQPYLEHKNIENVLWNNKNLIGIMKEENNYMGIYINDEPNNSLNEYKNRILIYGNTRQRLYTTDGYPIFGELNINIDDSDPNNKTAQWQINFYYMNLNGRVKVEYYFPSTTFCILQINYVFPFAIAPIDYNIKSDLYLI